MEPLESEFSCRLSLHQLLHRRIDPLTHQDLFILGLITQASGKIRDWTYRTIINSALEPDHSQSGIPLGDADPETQLVPMFLPLLGQLAHLLAHGYRIR